MTSTLHSQHGSHSLLDPLSAFLAEINKENIPPKANHKKPPPLRREDASLQEADPQHNLSEEEGYHAQLHQHNSR